MAEGGDKHYVELALQGRPLPLSSKRLTAVHVRQLAQTIELPTTTSPTDIRQMIKGKLTEMGHKPPTVQVIVQREIGGAQAHLYLQDESGVFLDLEPAPEPHPHGTAEESDKDTPEEEEGPEVVKTCSKPSTRLQKRIPHWLRR